MFEQEMKAKMSSKSQGGEDISWHNEKCPKGKMCPKNKRKTRNQLKQR